MIEQETVETLIVGFGFSSITLLRELSKRGQSFKIISSGKPIWQRLQENNKLHFDLVSSFHASVLSEDQVKDGALQDFFPTAQWNYEYHERLFQEFKDKVVDDKVVLVENYPEHSLVHTEHGTVYQARNVVFATGLARPQVKDILDGDWDQIKDKTVVVKMSGDSANMVLSKLVPNGNKCILVSNGYVLYDKFLGFDSPGPKGSNWYIPILGMRTGKEYSLDLSQNECHTLETYFPLHFKSFISLSNGPPEPDRLFSKIVWPHFFPNRYPESYRQDILRRNAKAKAGMCNGIIGIKYYKIDMYKLRFGGKSLAENISKGYLLNDLTFWHTEGLVETWPRSTTTIDQENKTILNGNDGQILSFDHYIEGGEEVPVLPRIVSIDENGKKHDFKYQYRDNFLGVVPSRLRNIFFVGYIRPSTGGLANLVEMQGLMIHKLLTDSKLKLEFYSNIYSQLEEYNNRYYGDEKRKNCPSDHLVWYGLYTRDVARFMGLERPLFRSTFSWNPKTFLLNLRYELLSPNNAIKFRTEGEYKVPGAEKYSRDIFAFNEHMSIILNVHLCFLVDRLLVYQCALMFIWKHSVEPFIWGGYYAAVGVDVFWNDMVAQFFASLAAALWVAFLVKTLEQNLTRLFLQTYSLPPPLFGIKAWVQPMLMAAIAWKTSGEWYWCFGIFALFSLFAYLGRQVYIEGVSGRYMFADIKYNHLHRPFWEEYKNCYAKVMLGKQTEKRVAS